MIFNFGENPTMDVIRMLLHYSLQQNKSEPQITIPPITAQVELNPVTTNESFSSENEGLRRLHVTNLPFKIKDHELRKYFEEYGLVQDAEIIYNERGSKGFGFVTMVTEADATKAKDALNGEEIDGRKIEINYATPKSSSKGRMKSRSMVGQTSPQNRVSRNQVIPSSYQQQWKSITPMVQQPYPFTAPPPPLSNMAPATPQNPQLAGYQYFPTPEQYTQYYNYLASQGAVQTPYLCTNNNATYRYQPY